MIKKALFIFALLFAIVICSCAKTKKDNSGELLIELLEVSGEAFESNGQFYFSTSKEGEIGYFSDDDKILTYGADAKSYIFDNLRGYAGFVSAREPAEIWIFECYSSSDTDKVVKMCLERADILKIAHKNSSWREKSATIRVIPHKKYVLFVFAENAERVENRLKELT